jgi:hypothetical protein
LPRAAKKGSRLAALAEIANSKTKIVLIFKSYLIFCERSTDFSKNFFYFFRKKDLTLGAIHVRLTDEGDPPFPPSLYLYTLFINKTATLYYYKIGGYSNSISTTDGLALLSNQSGFIFL